LIDHNNGRRPAWLPCLFVVRDAGGDCGGKSGLLVGPMSGGLTGLVAFAARSAGDGSAVARRDDRICRKMA